MCDPQSRRAPRGRAQNPPRARPAPPPPPAGVSVRVDPQKQRAGCRPPFPGGGCGRGPVEPSPGGPRGAWPPSRRAWAPNPGSGAHSWECRVSAGSKRDAVRDPGEQRGQSPLRSRLHSQVVPLGRHPCSHQRASSTHELRGRLRGEGRRTVAGGPEGWGAAGGVARSPRCVESVLSKLQSRRLFSCLLTQGTSALTQTNLLRSHRSVSLVTESHREEGRCVLSGGNPACGPSSPSSGPLAPEPAVAPSPPCCHAPTWLRPRCAESSRGVAALLLDNSFVIRFLFDRKG